MSESASCPISTIRNGYDLVTVFVEGQSLSREVSELEIAAQEAHIDSGEAITLMPDLAAILQDGQAIKKCVEARLTARDSEHVAAKLAELNKYAGEQVLGKGVIVENISDGPRPISIYYSSPDRPHLGLRGRPLRRHRAVGTIIGLDVSRNELVVKPNKLSPRGVLRDYWRISVVDSEGKPLVEVGLKKTRRPKNVLPDLHQHNLPVL